MTTEPAYYDRVFARRLYPSTMLDTYRAVVRQLEFLKARPDGQRPRVLDLGCGQGVLAGQLTHNGLDVVAVDFSEVAIQATQQNAPLAMSLVADLRVDDIWRTLGHYKADVAVFCEVLEHVEEDVAMIERAAQVAPLVIASVPNGDRIPDIAHLREYDQAEVRRRFSHVGDIRFIEYPGSDARLLFRVQVAKEG
jgi:2-polyprenyl-3-methyl-5-hydroxy-6-metoxy-1,4-benzoquinol methylase